MGTMFFIFCITCLLLILYVPLRLLSFKYRCSKVFAGKIHRMIFYRWWIVFIQEAYIDLFFYVCINFYSFSGTWDSFDGYLNNSLVVVIAIMLLILPITILAYICPNFRKLKKKRFMNKFGAIYDMVDLRHRQASALLWCIFFIGRRILFGVGVIFLKDYPLFQIYLFIFPTMAVLIMVGLARPLATPFENKQELYNNFTILALSYCLLSFTQYVPEAEMRYNMGYFLILLTIQNIVISLAIVAASPIR